MPEARPVSMQPTFTLQLNATLNPRQAVVAKFDGKNPCLASGTTGGKVVIHNPHDSSGNDPVRSLNINRTITALAAGPAKGVVRDMLYIGSESSLVAYDVEDNTDVFFKEIGDGVNTMVYGTVGNLETGAVIVGGNCSILGFDNTGEEKYWTVTGDNVRALAIIPGWTSGSNPKNTLLVGSDDLELRAYIGEEVLSSVTETAPAVQLMPTLHPGRFIYALSNGTVGVYDKSQRAWRYKSKQKIECVAACDIDFDGVAEVLCGWSNGKFEVRSDAGNRNGDLAFKDKLPSSVVSMLAVDYRLEGRLNPLVCCADGECRGYVAVETAMDDAAAESEQRMLEQLMQEKQSLQHEMMSLDKQAKSRAENKDHTPMPSTDIKVSCRLTPDAGSKLLNLILSVTEGAVIQACNISAEVIFGSAETLFVTSDNPGTQLKVCLDLEKDIAAELKIVAFVGFSGADCFQAYDLTAKLPKFSLYVQVKEFAADPTGMVTMHVQERPNRLVMWALASFNGYVAPDEKNTSFVARFVSIRDGTPLLIASTHGGEVQIRTDSMDIAGDIVQDLGVYLGLTELSSLVDFSKEFAVFQDVLTRVDEYNAVRMKLTAEMADSAQLVKALVIKAEDARIQSDMSQMNKMYGSLYEVNRELMGELMKRSNNHTELLAALKDVNAMIQKASRLRIGTAKTQLVADCRNAIKSNQINSLFKIIRTGKA